MNEKQYLWWQTGIIYQIYPRSFQDSNNDGIGDLKGIIKRLDYLSWLGVNIIWISPIYPSPMADFGYDISDYEGIHSLFGTMDDFDALLAEIHKRDMKLVLDLVPNHTSDQHSWFIESKSSRDSPKRDWYIWHDSKPDGSPPNNWQAAFGGSGWEWDEHTRQYYFHSFLKEQPDLNWRNPEVQEAMFDVMRFWLNKGVDGFRIDVLWHLIKDKQLRDNPLNPDYTPNMSTYEQLLPVFSTDQPEVQDIVLKMRSVVDEYKERLIIGEVYLPVHKLVHYYGPDNNGAHLPFNFQLIFLPWDAKHLAASVDLYEGALPLGGWPNWVLGNHDQVRIASRIGTGQSKIAAILLLTLRGTPTMYYGDEIGMIDVPVPKEEIVDPIGINMPDKNLSRDPARTPMQWDGTAYAGFSSHKPWLRLSKYAQQKNVTRLKEDNYSILMLYKRLIELRQNEPSLVIGGYMPIHTDEQMIVYKRKKEGSHAFMIALNLSHRPGYLFLNVQGTVAVATNPELEGTTVNNKILLYGDEGIVIRLLE